MNITKGKIQSAQKCVLFGPEGIGKSTFAAQFPNPLFIDTEGSTKHLDVRRFDPPTSWAMLLEQVRYVAKTPGVCQTLVVDTADWAERMCIDSVCAAHGWKSIEAPDYGKGYTFLYEEFGRFLNLLTDVIEKGVHVLLTAHVQVRQQRLPEEMGSFDHWELKLSKQVSKMVKEWADILLFANYKTLLVGEKSGAPKKAQGGQRVMYASHRPTWDAKNRHGLPDEMPLEFAAIAHCFTDPLAALAQRSEEMQQQDAAPPPPKAPEKPVASTQTAIPGSGTQPVRMDDFEEIAAPAAPPTSKAIHPKLAQLMQANAVTESEIQQAVASKKYFPEDMPVADYPEDFVLGVLVGAWTKVFALIQDIRNDDLPF